MQSHEKLGNKFGKQIAFKLNHTFYAHQMLHKRVVGIYIYVMHMYYSYIHTCSIYNIKVLHFQFRPVKCGLLSQSVMRAYQNNFEKCQKCCSLAKSNLLSRQTTSGKWQNCQREVLIFVTRHSTSTWVTCLKCKCIIVINEHELCEYESSIGIQIMINNK